MADALADAFHVASLRWRDPSRPSGGPPRLQQQSAHSIGRPPSPVFFLRDQSRVLRFGGAGLPHA